MRGPDMLLLLLHAAPAAATAALPCASPLFQILMHSETPGSASLSNSATHTRVWWALPGAVTTAGSKPIGCLLVQELINKQNSCNRRTRAKRWTTACLASCCLTQTRQHADARSKQGSFQGSQGLRFELICACVTDYPILTLQCLVSLTPMS